MTAQGKIISESDYNKAHALLQQAAAAYYEMDEDNSALVLSDAEYDALLAQVREYEEANGKSSAATSQVAAGAELSTDVTHSAPMLSLDNVFDDKQLAAFLRRTSKSAGGARFVAEPKLDGLAVAIRYEDGHPVQMVTRGDGTAGEDVSYALSQIENLPEGSNGFTGEVRGEAIFTRSQFENANRMRAENDKTPFANARNGAAGALRGARNRGFSTPMSFFAYDVANPQDLLSICSDHGRQVQGPVLTHCEAINLLTQAGFATAYGVLGRPGDAVPLGEDEVQKLIAELHDPTKRDALPVVTDGVVIKVDGYEGRQVLGSGSKSPRWATAFKFPPDEATSTLEEIIWQVGRTGVITPRARIAPTELGGVVNEYATLHNPGDIQRKGFMMGDVVILKRAGEVIPRLEAPIVARRDGSQTQIVMPTTCPLCGGPVDTSQARWKCAKGRMCATPRVLSYAVSRDALDIEGLGPVQVDNLVSSGKVMDIADLLENGLDEAFLVEHGKVAEANAPKIVEQVRKARSAPLARVVTALGISGTGRSMSRRLAKHFGTLDALRKASVEDLVAVDKIGEVKAPVIVDELASLSDLLDRLQAMGMGDQEQERPAEGTATAPTLAGQAVCVTGSLKSRTRTELHELIESLGGRASSSVSKSTSILVAGEKAGSKLEKAKQLGVKVMTEDEFLAEYA